MLYLYKNVPVHDQNIILGLCQFLIFENGINSNVTIKLL
jgi:hypothetical protein